MESLREAKPLLHNQFPLSFEGEGDKGGEVDKQSFILWQRILKSALLSCIKSNNVLCGFTQSLLAKFRGFDKTAGRAYGIY